MEFLKAFFACDKEERHLIAQAIKSRGMKLIFIGYVLLLVVAHALGLITLNRDNLAFWLAPCFMFSVLTYIDVKHYILPDHITLPLIPLLFVIAPFISGITYTQSAIGLLGAGGLFALIAWTFYRLTGKHGMGGGDIKLMAGLGAWTGFGALPALLLLASLSSSITLAVRKRLSGTQSSDPIPFGPFLCVGAVLAILLQDIYWQGVNALFGN